MSNKLLNRLHLMGFLSFAPGSVPVELTPLNVLIGPNGAGKSNFIAAIELLRATPTDLDRAIRARGAPGDWIWRGGPAQMAARIEAVLSESAFAPKLNYALTFVESRGKLEIVDELLERADEPGRCADDDVPFYYRFQHGHPVIDVNEAALKPNSLRPQSRRKLKLDRVDRRQSILSQRKDPHLYPEMTAAATRFSEVQVLRQCGFERRGAPSWTQPASCSTDALGNLGLKLNEMEQTDVRPMFHELMQQFLPRYERVSRNVVDGGAVEIFLHEEGLNAPIPATRISDGTLRFLGLLAILLDARSCPLICIEEPELGLHPDAMSLLADLLVEAAAKTQLIVTTHSDALVSALTEQVESVLVCDYLENGTTLQRLEAEKLQLWLKDYPLGDIWRAGKLGGNLW